MLKKLAVLSALPFVLVAGLTVITAQADCPHEGRTDHLHCDAAVGGASTFVLLDGNLDPIGRVIEIGFPSAQAVLILLEVEDSSGTTRNIVIQIRSSPPSIDVRERVMYNVADCNENNPLAELFVRHSNVFPGSLSPSAITRGPTSSVERRLYVATSDIPQTVSVLSQQPGGFGVEACENFSPPLILLNLVAAELIDSDLRNTFPLPYTLILQ